MRKGYTKTFFRDIRKSFGRFVAIIGIVALGVGFLTGLLATTPNMQSSVDKYYDDYNAADIFMKSSRGFHDKDIEEITNIEGVDAAMGFYSADIVTNIGGATPVVRVFGLPLEKNDEASFINKLELLSGNMPQNENECVTERGGDYLMEVPLGTIIDIAGKDYTVVGTVANTWYFSNEREMTEKGSGKLGAIIYTSSFEMPVLTDVYVTVSGAKKLNAYTDRYEKEVNEVATKIKTEGARLNEEWYNQIIESDPGLSEVIKMPSWYVLDRQSVASFKSFGMNSDKVASVATIFPAFFFLVAALVTLTTMTRMVEEERTQIGTYKALGYSNTSIRGKYIAYCLIATLIGCIVGVLVGFQLIPSIIWNAFQYMFHLPSMLVQFNYFHAGIASLAAILSTMFATIWACNNTLREKPAQLLQPKAPKPGKRIFLERIGFIWNHLKFKYKSTFRNIFRYKKHLLMTVIGIGGCTALILTGFGMSDSFNGITSLQYEKIYNYDLSITVKDMNAENPTLNEFLNSESVSDKTSVYQSMGYAKNENSDKNKEVITLYSPENSEEFSGFVSIAKRGKKGSEFNDDSCVITEKIASHFSLKEGDSVLFEDISGKQTSYKITGITENYVNSYLYVGKNVYTAANEGRISPNFLLVKSTIKEDSFDAVTEKLLNSGDVSGVEFNAVAKSSFDKLLSAIDLVVLVLIIAAGGLAVIVLYNLTNININERKKELATLKVLGYRNGEVAGYIYREIAILTVIGILVGLGLGVLLHWFVIVQAESVGLMFARTISPLSFLFSALITLAFSIVVDLLMLIKVKKINMVDSMKAPE